MPVDYCFTIYNFAPHQRATPRGASFPATSFFLRPLSSAFTFGPKQMSPEHVHVTMPTPVASSFSGVGGEFVVNSDRTFVIFNPIKKDLTYEEVLFPSSETHEPIVAFSNTHHKLTPGGIIVGVDTGRPDNMFLCFAFFLNGSDKSINVPTMDLIYNAPQVISHFRAMEKELRNKLISPWEKIVFKGNVLKFGERLKATMPPKSFALLSMEAAATTPPKRAASEPEAAPVDPKRVKA